MTEIGVKIANASTVTISKFGPSGSLIRKNKNLEVTNESMSSRNNRTFLCFMPAF